MKRKRLFWVALGISIALLFAVAVPSAGPQPQELAGTWFVEGINVNPPPGFGTTFLGLHTYIGRGNEGQMVGSSTTSPSIAGPARGEWESLGGGQFAVTFQFFAYDASGTATNLLRVNSTIELDRWGETFSGVHEFKFMTLDGQLLFIVSGTHTATRVGVERIP